MTPPKNRRQTWILAGAGCLLLVLGLLGVGLLALTSIGTSVRQQLGTWLPGGAKDLPGTYEMLAESGGWHPAKGARITLTFGSSGTLALRALRPGETLTDTGTYTRSGSRITLHLPGLEQHINNGTFHLEGTTLTLPLQLFGEGSGTSTWKRLDSPTDPMSQATLDLDAVAGGESVVLKTVAERLRAQRGVASAKICGGSTVAVTYANGYREFFLAPPLSRTQASKTPSEAEALEPARYQLRPSRLRAFQRTQFMLPGAPGMPLGIGVPTWRQLGPEPIPVSKGDAPPERRALILAPFQTLSVLIPGAAGAAYPTFQEKDERLEEIQAHLQHAGYDTSSTFTDQQVTVKRLYDLLRSQTWGVVFVSTHSGIEEDEGILVTGEQIPAECSATPEDRKAYLDRLAVTAFGREASATMKDTLVTGFIYRDRIPFVAVKSSFFKAIGADFSRSLVVLAACESAAESYQDEDRKQSVLLKHSFRSALGARSFAGWKGPVDSTLAAHINQAFFRCLSLKTRSDREAMQFAQEFCLSPRGHDWDLKQRAAAAGDKSKMDPRAFVVYRQGKTQPEKTLNSRQVHIMSTVRSWCCLMHAGEGLDRLMDVLQAYDPDRQSAINPQFFEKLTLNLKDIPDQELDEIKGELCGYGGQPARFTLFEP